MNNQADESAVNISSEKPVQHKWPIRPGVHVHVNGLHTLNNSGNTSSTGGTGPTTVHAENFIILPTPPPFAVQEMGVIGTQLQV